MLLMQVISSNNYIRVSWCSLPHPTLNCHPEDRDRFSQNNVESKFLNYTREYVKLTIVENLLNDRKTLKSNILEMTCVHY